MRSTWGPAAFRPTSLPRRFRRGRATAQGYALPALFTPTGSAIAAEWYRIGPEDTGDNFPFVSPSNDLLYLFADARLTLPMTSIPQLPLRIGWISGLSTFLGLGRLSGLPTTPPAPSGGDAPAAPPFVLPGLVQSHPCDVVIVDADGQVIFNSTIAPRYRGDAYGPSMYVHRWATGQGEFRLVHRTTWPTREAAWLVPVTYKPRNGILDARVIVRPPMSVSSLGYMSGDVTIQAGYNATIAARVDSTDPIRPLTVISIGAVPGAGLGQSPGCTGSETPLQSLGGVSPNKAGNLSISGDGCYWVRPVPILSGTTPTGITPGVVQIGNDCSPCYNCSDFVAAGAALNGVFAAFQALAADAEAIRDAMAAAVTRWEPFLGSQSQVDIQFKAFLHDTNYVDFGFQVCNPLSTCLPEYAVEVDISLGGPGAATATCDFAAGSVYLTDACGVQQAVVPVYGGSVSPKLGSTPGHLTGFVATFATLQPTSKGMFRATLVLSGLSSAGLTIGFYFPGDGIGRGSSSFSVTVV